MKFGFKRTVSAKLEDSLNSEFLKKASDIPEDELFNKAPFNESEVEKTAYSNYSYWRCTFNEFRKHKMAKFLFYIMAAILLFTFIQPFLPNQYDPNVTVKYTKTSTNKWGKTTEKEYLSTNIQPYLVFQINKILNAIGLVNDDELMYTPLEANEDGEFVKISGDEYFNKYGKFLLGSNEIGQDLWARIWSGTRNSLAISFCVAFIEALLGIIAGVLWGYVRKLDFIFTEIYNVLDNIPNTLLLILISYVMKPGVMTLIFALSLTGWIQMARFIRNQILIIRDRDYNTASRCLGTSTAKILFHNCLPYLISVIMLRMALTIPAVIGSEVFVTYVGLGLPNDVPSLGRLVVDGKKLLGTTKSYQLLYPVIILSIVTISFYVIGNAFSDAADPKNHK